MWAEVNGERKKVACGPCIRGHRSSKCDHRDRVLVEVRKPGRPLSSCPHPSGSCSCERVVINYTIPKSSECACPSDRAQPTAAVAGNSRIQKNRRRSTAINSVTLERAIRAGQDVETDTSSTTRTPTERSGSNDASPLSSASSTPRLLPAQSDGMSSCCKPKPVAVPAKQSSCCSSKAKPLPEPAPVKSCCSSKAQPNSQSNQAGMYSQFGQQFQFQIQPQIPVLQYPSMQSHTTSSVQLPFGLGAPIYNHAAAAYQQQTIVPMSPIVGGQLGPHLSGQQITRHVPEHNCHCGDSCSCFGCAAHPNNATMSEYIRMMAEFQYTGTFGAMSPPLYDMPTYPHHPGFGAEVNQSLGFPAMSPAMSSMTPTQMNYPTNLGMSVLSQPLVTTSGPWQQPVVAVNTAHDIQVLEPSSYAASDRRKSEVYTKMEETVATPPADSPADSKDEDTPILSPSTFFWNQMVMPSCNDATGTCQCGDGCACVGCLTHGGHTGEQLEAPTLEGSESFPELSADVGLNMGDPNDFLAFHTTPT